MKRKKYYYHVTSKENLESILANGLKANEDGDIFLFIDDTYLNYFGSVVEDNVQKIGPKYVDVIDDICFNQVFLYDECVKLRINSKGLKGELIEDVIPEIPSRLHKQWIARQDVIEPKWITYELYTPKQGHLIKVLSEIDLSEQPKNELSIFNQIGINQEVEQESS